MDNRTKYNKIVNLLKPIIGQTISLDKLRRRIMIDIGASDIVVHETISLMMELGLIREVEHLVFIIVSAEADI